MTSDLPALPPRPPDGHKGTFGTVCVIGGQAASPRVMLGGPAFTALGALRVGCGLAVLAVPEPIMAEALTVAPEATGLALPVDRHGVLRPSEAAALLDRHLPSMKCLAIGPGMGDGVEQQQIVIRLIAQDQAPLVIDADAINALAASRDFHRDLRAPAVLTPHPGEYRRLADALGIEADPVDAGSREDAASQLAQRLGCVIVLKGHQTIVSDGQTTWMNTTGSVALATAGSGDVLTGVIAGLIAQHFKAQREAGSMRIDAFRQGGLSLLDCARWGVRLHGLAADRWAAKHGSAGKPAAAGMLASDLLNEIPDVLAEARPR
jgi:ADP-dependent NAD(P)H-hydrate dehydratase